MGVSLLCNGTRCCKAWTLEVISKDRKLSTPMSVGVLLIISGRVHIIFNFRSKSFCSGAIIETLCGIFRTGAANFIEGIQHLSCPKKISCGPIFLFLNQSA